MVYLSVFILITAAIITFAVIQVMTPFLYTLWFDQLRDNIAAGTLRDAGDNMFNVSWTVMSYVVPGILILWAIVLGNQKRSREEAI